MNNPWKDGCTGFCEAVVAVSHFGKVGGLARAVGYRLLHEGPAAPELRRCWSVKPHAVIEEQLFGVPGLPYGWLRFCTLGGVPQVPIRPLDARPWETGGLWLLYARAAEGGAASRALAAAGWPTIRGQHAFDFGDLAVREVHHLGPDGLVLSVIEQSKPPLELPVTGPGLTPVFNAAMTVRDFAAARRFFVDGLGFKPWMELTWPGDHPGLGLLADPADLAGVRSVTTAILHPEGTNQGSVELIAWDGAPPGRDFAERARPPNLGAVALRFAVGDLDALLARLLRIGVHPARTVAEFVLAPYGRVRLAPVISPDGVRLEFFEVVGDADPAP